MIGLEHLAKSLFAERPTVSPLADGLTLIAAAGDVGEARLAARQVRTWIDSGVAPENIVVIRRNLAESRALLQEVFDEYSVPTHWPEPEPVIKCGAVAMLLNAWRLPVDDFRFRDVAALWRNSYFRPDFETELPLRAESLLRQLGVTRGRDAFVEAVQTIAEDRLPLPLEDETLDPSRAARSQLAKRCLGFFQWFFQFWDGWASDATWGERVSELRRLADAFGLSKPLPHSHDDAALAAFWQALDSHPTSHRVGREEFLSELETLARQTPWEQPEELTAVRMLDADTASEFDCSHLVVMGLGENSFPRLTERNIVSDLAAEQALFKQIVTTPRTALVLSYPATDARGVAMLPGMFLEKVRGCFAQIPTVRQTMLLDGFLTWPPLSAAEARTQAALKSRRGLSKQIADARHRSPVPNVYSGVLADSAVINAVARRLGPRKIFSPTSLEKYVACPFRYWLEQVLGLEPLEEPAEDVSVSRRGSAIHRTLARYHQQVSDLNEEWTRAVAEQKERTAGAASRMLWDLEQRRVRRYLARYPSQSERFRSQWSARGVVPTPNRFEAMFGYESHPDLRLEIAGNEVRLGGIIDRVDFAELTDGRGFWIIDYKSGRGTEYRAKDLETFERLQLPLYALAVERLMHDGEQVRPLGLAYWLIAKDGPKLMLPSRVHAWADDETLWPEYRAKLERVVVQVVRAMRHGDFRLAPRNQDACTYCPFRPVCRISQSRDRWTPIDFAASGEGY